MEQRKQIVIFPQWQGGGDRVTLDGAEEIRSLYLRDTAYDMISVSGEDTLRKEHDIIGFDLLRSQMAAAGKILRSGDAEKIFMIGGGCDADVPAVSCLNERCGGDLTLLWLDAHGDLNAPWESGSSLFYGMPLRSLMDEDCFGLHENSRPLRPGQLIHLGGRDLDIPEEDFIRREGIVRISVSDYRDDPGIVCRRIREAGNRHLYVHLDLDVLDAEAFPYTPLPVPGGLQPEELMQLLDAVRGDLTGFGLYEYRPAGKRLPLLESLVRFGLAF